MDIYHRYKMAIRTQNVLNICTIFVCVDNKKNAHIAIQPNNHNEIVQIYLKRKHFYRNHMRTIIYHNDYILLNVAILNSVLNKIQC